MSPPEQDGPRLSSVPTLVDVAPGRVIAGNFRVEALIGAGAMGNVYRAEQLSLGKAVAVKVLHAHLMSDERLVMRFQREAKSASRLNHPHSVQIIDSGRDGDGTLYIAMELLAGRDLAQVLRDEFPLPLQRVGRIMTQVLEALDEAHAQGIVHRDLKPSNIMLIERRGERDFVKVCDFGIAKAMSEGKEGERQDMLTVQGLVCGTPEYMAPEQARAETLDGRADLYAAAVILYQLVTGDIPFHGGSPVEIVAKHLSEAAVPPSQRRPDLPIPKGIDQVVARGMEKGREGRYQSALELRDALLAALAAAGVHVPPSGLGMPAAGATPLPPGMRAAIAAMPTRRAPTADVARPRRGWRGVKGWAVALVGVALAVGVAVTVGGRSPSRDTTASTSTTTNATTSTTRSTTTSTSTTAAVPAAAVPTAAAVPSAAVPAAAVPLANAPAKLVVESPPARKHRKLPEPSLAAEPAAPPPAPVVEAPPPAVRGAKEMLAEGERLLSQGEVAEACARGEEAKQAGGKLPAVYKFLGKCYMRAGNAERANDNYRKYLELAPAASDAPFIKSMIK